MLKSFAIIYLCVQQTLGKIRYNTYEDFSIKRSTPYSPRVISKTCLLKPQVGPCRGNISMYYFDPANMNCSKFHWGGCQGNGNRYDSRSECMETCLSKRNPANTRPTWCSLRFDYGYCFGDEKRWYYDSMWKVCKQTIYSGCGGNKNNFEDQYECESFCIYGVPALRTSTVPYDKLDKVVIVNSDNATTKKSAKQITTKATTKKDNCTTSVWRIKYKKKGNNK